MKGSLEILQEGVQTLGISVSAEQRSKLLAYAALLAKWNRVYNLTALRDEETVLTHHLLDSLAILPYLDTTQYLLDVGSGGGLPGIPLAITRPEMMVCLVESNNKKATFLNQVRIELHLQNVTVQCVRVEEWFAERQFDVIVSRAFSDLETFARLTTHLLAPRGKLLAMKGIYPQGEVDALPSGWRIDRVEELTVPGINASRHLVWMVPQQR